MKSSHLCDGARQCWDLAAAALGHWSWLFQKVLRQCAQANIDDAVLLLRKHGGKGVRTDRHGEPRASCR